MALISAYFTLDITEIIIGLKMIKGNKNLIAINLIMHFIKRLNENITYVLKQEYIKNL